MSAVNDGGPAFGRVVSQRHGSLRTPVSDSCTFIDTVGGMSLRDWFAGQALPSLVDALLKSAVVNGFSKAAADHVAPVAYEFADAMLAARNKQEGSK